MLSKSFHFLTKLYGSMAQINMINIVGHFIILSFLLSFALPLQLATHTVFLLVSSSSPVVSLSVSGFRCMFSVCWLRWMIFWPVQTTKEQVQTLENSLTSHILKTLIESKLQIFTVIEFISRIYSVNVMQTKILCFVANKLSGSRFVSHYSS